nr:AbrB/MazE/SpoVT family DNA-binding domain-containing protein [Halomicrobium zhouii]
MEEDSSRDTVSIDGDGRITIPESIRTRLGLEAGDRLVVDDESGFVRLRPPFEPLKSERTTSVPKRSSTRAKRSSKISGARTIKVEQNPRSYASSPVVLVPAFVMLESTLDVEWFPATLTVENVGEQTELTIVELDPSVSPVRNVVFGPEFVEHLTRLRIVSRLNCSDREQTLFVDRGPPLVFRHHRSQESTFHGRFPHT